MTTTQKRWAIAAALLVGFLLFSQACLHASASERRITSRERHGGAVLTTWINPEPRGGCTAVIRGWWLRHRATSPEGVHQYTYGYWGGSFCSNGRTIFSVSWGKPGGEADWPWQWHPSDSYMSANDNTGDARRRTWRSHFSSSIGPLNRHDYPWLSVRLLAGEAPRLDHGCGC